MADIVLKDRNGNDVTYEGIETVTFDTPTEGEQVTFTEGVAVSDIPIALDFSAGDQTITAPAGTLVKSAVIAKPADLAPENVRNGKEIGGISGTFIGDTEELTVDLNMAEGDQVIVPTVEGKVISKVTVKKPETLVPENIAEGVDIAGIIGTLAAGGAKLTNGIYSPTGGGAETINHNLGSVPDMIMIWGGGYDSAMLKQAFGYSEAFFSVLKGSALMYSHLDFYIKGSTLNKTYPINTMENRTTGPDIFNVTEQSFSVGSSNTPLEAGFPYYWLAIGGLT